MKNEIQSCSNDTCTIENSEQKSWVRPHYELERNDEAFRLRVYVPGTGKSGVKLSVSEGILSLTAERSDSVPEGWKPLSRELSRDDYKLEVRVPQKVDVSTISANIENGILSLSLPISEAAKPRVIEVE